MDSVSKEVRSRIMSRVKQRDSEIELRLRAALWRAGFRYRKHVRVRGTPDLLMNRDRLVVFVDSCFWHGCRYHCRKPKSNVEFWANKIARNRARDRRVNAHYRRRGWTVIRFWEHQLKDLDRCVQRVRNAVAARRRIAASCDDTERV